MLKRTTEEVREYFKEQGCELLGEYKGAQIKMEYRCHCGNVSNICWNHFSRGKRCGLCVKRGQKKKRSLEDIKKIFEDRGCKFLDDVYNGVEFNHNYQCKCGRVAKISFIGFYHQNQNCHACGLEKNKKSNHHMWNPDREQLALNKKFAKKCYKAIQSSLEDTNQVKVGRTKDLLGYSPKDLQEHIVNHPNWNSVKDGNWAVDHIFPIKAFVDHDIKDIGLINCLENLQPLSQKDNNKKSHIYDKQKFQEWLKTKLV